MQRNELMLDVYVGWDINDARESVKIFGFDIRIIDNNTSVDNVINKMRINFVAENDKIVKVMGCY